MACAFACGCHVFIDHYNRRTCSYYVSSILLPISPGTQEPPLSNTQGVDRSTRDEKVGLSVSCKTPIRPKARIPTIRQINVNRRVINVLSISSSLAMAAHSHTRAEPMLRCVFSWNSKRLTRLLICTISYYIVRHRTKWRILCHCHAESF